MIVIERTIWERKEHASINLSAIKISWIIAKNNIDSQNQEIINRKNKILKYYRKADVSHTERGH